MVRIKTIMLLVMALLPSMLCMGKEKESPDTISARRAFMEMPVSGDLDLLSKDTRFNMLAYYDNDSIYHAPNNLKGLSYLEKVTDNFLAVRITDESSLQIKILKLKNGNDIVMTIHTVGKEGEVMDSNIKFYNTSFVELPTDKYFKAPKVADFFQTKGFKTSMKEIEEMLPFFAVCYQADAANNYLKGRLTIEDAVTEEDQKILELMMKPSVTFEWKGNGFKEIKN